MTRELPSSAKPPDSLADSEVETALQTDAAMLELPGDLGRALRRVRRLALERFPKEKATLDAFFSGLCRELKSRRGSAVAEEEANLASEAPRVKLLTQLEDYLDALLVGEARGGVGR